MKLFRFAVGVALTFMIAGGPDPAAAQTDALSIVVLEGEGAVNVIQQKTAISALVEVRDINGQPVGGATVKFTIQGASATFNGAPVQTVTTNAAGRAAMTGPMPTSSGAFQISASATFQGQTAVATIAQTNVMTAAQAASIAGGSGVGGGAAAGGAAAGGAVAGGAAAAGGTAAGGAAAGGAATGGAAAGGAAAGGAAAGGAAAGGAAAGGAAAGGGLSAVTLGIVGGAVAGGAIASKQVLGGGGGVSIYEGDFRIDVVESHRSVRGNGTIVFSCTTNISFTGEVRGEIDEQEGGTLVGTISANGFYKDLGTTCPPSAPGPANEKISFGKGDVIGTTAGFQANGVSQAADGTGSGTLGFSGTLTDGVITGTFTIGPTIYKSIPDATGAFGDSVFPATSTQVRLTK